MPRCCTSSRIVDFRSHPPCNISVLKETDLNGWAISAATWPRRPARCLAPSNCIHVVNCKCRVTLGCHLTVGNRRTFKKPLTSQAETVYSHECEFCDASVRTLQHCGISLADTKFTQKVLPVPYSPLYMSYFMVPIQTYKPRPHLGNCRRSSKGRAHPLLPIKMSLASTSSLRLIKRGRIPALLGRNMPNDYE